MRIFSKPRILYATMTISALIGFIASFMQMLEKLTKLANPEANLICNINSVFSCSNLLDVWQSSVFGFPNALMCIILFTILFTAGLIGWTGGTISKNMRLILQFLALFFIGFGFWYLCESIFTIGAMCIYCIACYGAVLVISHCLLRINYKELTLGKKCNKFIEKCVNNQTDSLVWIIIAIIIIIEMFIKFS